MVEFNPTEALVLVEALIKGPIQHGLTELTQCTYHQGITQ